MDGSTKYWSWRFGSWANIRAFAALTPFAKIVSISSAATFFSATSWSQPGQISTEIASTYAGRRSSCPSATHEGFRTSEISFDGSYPAAGVWSLTGSEKSIASEPSNMYGPEETRNRP